MRDWTDDRQWTRTCLDDYSTHSKTTFRTIDTKGIFLQKCAQRPKWVQNGDSNFKHAPSLYFQNPIPLTLPKFSEK